jgi:leucine dehydrogenase
MSVFAAPDFDDHQEVVFHADPATGLRAIVAIHNTNLGSALGGTRMWPYADDDEALADVLRLSRGMTYKAAVAGLDFGGGKAVIIGDARRHKTDALLRAYGRFIDSLGGRYLTAEDVGTTVADMDVVRTVTRFAHGVSDGADSPSPATAFGVYWGIRAALRHRFGSDDLIGRRVAVQGIGSVGLRLCRYLAEAGARLIVADVDEDRVRQAVARFAAEAVPPGAIHAVPADVLAPCALGAVVDDATLPEIAAQVIAGAANNQLAEARHGAALKGRGILYAPDYVINAGGVIDVASEGPGYDRDAVLGRVARIYDTLVEIFARAAGADLPPDVVADRLAEERFRAPEHPRQAA